jgi:DNA-directed RNA polymerase specialized sigma24 family protein
MLISQEESDCYENLSKDLNIFLKLLMKLYPILRKEWEPQDFEQELALKYFKNLAKISHILKEGDHRMNLLKRMARQLACDKIRSMQRIKRDVKKVNNLQVDIIAEKKQSCALELRELIDNIQSKTPEPVWMVLQLRSQGKSWQECCDDCNYISPAALRQKVNRHVVSLKA